MGCSNMSVTPLVYDDVTGTHRPAGAGEIVMLSTQNFNMLRYGNDHGLFLDGNDVLSNGAHDNLLTIDSVDKKIILTKDSLIAAGFLSGEAGDLLSSHERNLIAINPSDRKIYLTPEILINAGFLTSASLGNLISTDANNAIKKGSDGLLYAALDCGELE